MRWPPTPHDSDQLTLDLYPGAPWGGRSPRGLTRVGLGVIFNAERESHEVDPDPAQLDFWPCGSKATRVNGPAYGGASTLLPLKKPSRRSPAGRHPFDVVTSLEDYYGS